MRVPELETLDPRGLAGIMDARILAPSPGGRPGGVSTDTRTIRPGELFFAVRGRRFDGHAFVADAMGRGAWGAVISSARGSLSSRCPGMAVYAVEDTLAAFGRLARFVRLRRPSLRVVGITGSNGKTTTKEMVKKALGVRAKTAASPASYNNFVGVPLSLCAVPPDARFAVIEMGTESPGEIARLAETACPDIALVTNVGETHLKGLGSRDGVAREKASVYRYLRPGGVGVINADDSYAEFFSSLVQGERVTFGTGNDADVAGRVVAASAEGFVLELREGLRLRCNVPGTHNAANLLAALAVCKAAGFPPEEFEGAFEDLDLPSMRMERTERGGTLYYNDAYNANPQSVRAGLAFFRDVTPPPGGRKILVLGEMRDLGADSARLHAEVGDSIDRDTADVVLLVGEETRHTMDRIRGLPRPPRRIVHCSGVRDARESLRAVAGPGDVVYLKASRSVGLECVLGEDG